MKNSPFVSALCIAILLSCLPATAKLLLKQNFDSAQFAPGALKDGGDTSGVLGGSWKVVASTNEDFTLVTEQVASAPYALKVMRNESVGYVALKVSPLDGYDYSLKFSSYLPTGNGIVLQFYKDGINAPMGGILLQAGYEPKAYNISVGWQPCGEMQALPANQWVECKVLFNAMEKSYRPMIVSPDDKEKISANDFPFLTEGPFDEIRFINILPVGCYTFIDDVVVEMADAPTLTGRINLADDATSAHAGFARLLAGEPFDALAGVPFEIEFSPEATIGALLITAKDDIVPPVTLRALNSLGHWIEIGENLPFGHGGYLQFKPLSKILKLSMQFSAAATLTGCKVYPPAGPSHWAVHKAWADKLDAEYRLPVYDMQYAGHDKAELTLVNHTDATLKVDISLMERNTKQDFGNRQLELPPGRTSIYYDLRKFPNGEYLTSITDASVKQRDKAGKIQRLLRHRTSPPCQAIPRKDMTGEKMFFPDGFFLEKYSGIDFLPAVAERHLVTRGVPGNDDAFIQMGEQIFLDKDGRIRVNFHTMNRLWQIASTKKYNAVALDDSLDRWEISEGTAQLPPQDSPLSGDIPPLAKPDWNEKLGPDGKIEYHFYDPEKHGPVNLNQIRCLMISPSAPGTAGYQKYDWKILTPAPCTVWPIWYRSPGEAIILTRTPLVDTFPPSGALEPGNSGSDLGFGQWLEDDGKTFCYGHGRHLIRYMPYIARYDNLYDRARIVAVWRTKDGIHWEQNYVAPPSDNKPIADQQYGGAHFRVPNGAGLRVAFLNRYDAFHQQISWELIYTWDGFRWTRFQDKPQLMPNGPLGDWFHAGGYTSTSAVERNGKIYQLMYWVNDHYHFQSEIVHSSQNTVSNYTEEYMRRRYEPRHLEDWPFFQKHFQGSWKKLAEHTRNATSGIGIMVYRKDGFFAAQAGAEEAHMLTVPVIGKRTLSMNASINDGGFVEVRLLANGKPLPGYQKRLLTQDSVHIPLFEQLPDGEFQIELILQNTQLYSITF
jgi:hypothetical protein